MSKYIKVTMIYEGESVEFDPQALAEAMSYNLIDIFDTAQLIEPNAMTIEVLDTEDAVSNNSLREALAEVSHEIWAHWMRYLFSKCHKLENGDQAIPYGSVVRWTLQAETPYADLTEREKDSDREQADKILLVLDTEDDDANI